MIGMRPARLIVASFAALAMILLVNVRAAHSQDADSGTSVDAAWDSTGPAIDESADSADKVLEIPQATCADGSSGPCDPTTAEADSSAGTGDDGQAINAPSPSAPPTTDTASSAPSVDDWGTVDEYQNQQQVYAVPYAVYPHTVAATTGTVNRPSPQLPGSAYVSSPLTQAARPPLNPGPWMNSASTSAFGRPAGGPMVGMMSSPAWGFHH